MHKNKLSKISTPIFFIMLIIILLIPILPKSKLLLFGEKANGKVIEVRIMPDGAQSSKYSIIGFNAEGTSNEIWAPQNIMYDDDEIIEILYEKGNPQNCMINSRSYIYSSPLSSISGVLLLIWFAFYTIIKTKLKQKTPR